MQRYAVDQVQMGARVGTYAKHQYLGDVYASATTKEISFVGVGVRNWDKVQKAYPWMYEFITENFGKKFWNYIF